jgi:hypothetical protein
MSAIAISVVIFVCLFGGALFGVLLRTALPDTHLSVDAKDVMKLGLGLIGTMAALVLGLLIAFTTSSFKARSGELEQMAANIMQLDRVLARYGPEANDARHLLRDAVAGALNRLWPKESSGPASLQPIAGWVALDNGIRDLSPQNDAQRTLQAEALRTATDLVGTRWLLFEQRGSSIPTPFLFVLGFWLTIIFVCFGLFAPLNATLVVTQFVCALSVSGAIFLILEMDTPLSGFIQNSSAPLRTALANIGG